MNPRVKNVQPEPDYTLLITFNNGEQKIFDVKPYLHKGIFSALEDKSIFTAVKPFNGSVVWPGDLDLCPDTLYEDGVTIKMNHA
jgi:uncharacterized protein DUF2442